MVESRTGFVVSWQLQGGESLGVLEVRWNEV